VANLQKTTEKSIFQTEISAIQHRRRLKNYSRCWNAMRCNRRNIESKYWIKKSEITLWRPKRACVLDRTSLRFS